MSSHQVAGERRAPFGGPCLGLLEDAITSAQAADPMRPVTVVVPSGIAALTLRRWWATRAGASIGVRFVLLSAVADIVAGPSMAASGRRRADTVERHAAVTAAMRERGGPLALGAGRPAAVRAVADRLVELRRLPSEGQAAVGAAGPSGGSLVALARDVAGRLEGTFDAEDLAAAAAAQPVPRELGAVIVYLPTKLSAAERALVEHLLTAEDSVLIAGVTGDDDPGVALPVPARVVRAPDPDLEGRVAAREVLAAVRAGTAPERTAVLYRATDPYARIVRAHLVDAGLSVAGPDGTELGQTVAGRTLLALLALPASRYSRQAVMAVLAGAPVAVGDASVPVTRWEAIARDANVVNHPERWAQRLATFATKERERADTDALAAFVRQLVADVDVASAASTWAAAAAAWQQLLDTYLDRSRLDDVQLDHLAHVSERVAQLGRLDPIVRRPPPDAIVAALEVALAVPASAPVAGGVYVGPVGTAVGTTFDVIVVVGMAEGWFPPRRADDPLLPDRLREAASLDHRRQWRQDERRAFLAVAATPQRLVLLSPAADPRTQRPLAPSRWWLEAAAASGPGTETESIDSFSALAAGVPASAADVGLQRAAAGVVEDPAVARGIEAVAARASGGLSVWEGAVGRHPSLSLDPGRALSPTSLQRWAECPRRYYLEYVLGVGQTNRPEDTVQLHPLEYGTLVHAALENFFRARGEAGEVGLAWGAADVEELMDDVEQLCRDAEARGITGLAVPWALQRRDLRERLQRLLGDDAERRAPDGLLPVSFEVGFGGGEDEGGPITYVAGARTLRFKGRIDRIDASPDGRVVHVLDYKTGQARRYAVLGDDPVDEGRLLQLPVYALAARASYPDADITAAYWFVTATDTNTPATAVPLNAATEARFAKVMEAIADGIEDGVFPANPGAAERDTWSNCKRCQFGRVCPADREDIWERVSLEPGVEPYRRLRQEVDA